MDGARRPGPRSLRRSGAAPAPVVLPALAVATLALATLGVEWLPSRAAGAAYAGATPSRPPAAVLTWSEAHPAAAPPPLTGASAAWDGDTSTVVLFGGVSSNGAVGNDTWTWDGSNWSDHPASVTNAPPARQGASLAFDPVLHRLILFGGQATDGSLLQDTWAWNGQQWAELSTGSQPGLGPSPAPRAGAAMSFDPRGDLVLFGGTGYAPADAPVSTTTTTTGPAAGGSGATGPSGGSGQAGTAATGGAGQTGGTGLTGGSAQAASSPSPGLRVLGDTWQWTASGWVLASTSGPPALSGASMAYDSTSLTTVLFGGSTSPAGVPAPATANQTWTWDGLHWAAARSAATPSGRYSAVLADAPALGGVVLMGGASSAGVLADGWSWTPAAGWAPARMSGTYAPRSGAAWAGAVPTPASPAGSPSLSAATGPVTLVFGGIDAAGNILGDTETVTAARPPATTSPRSTPPTTAAAHAGPTIPTVTSGHPGHRSPTTPPTTARTTPSTAAAHRPTTTVPAPVAVTPAPAHLSLETSESTVHRGATVRVAGSGFRPGSPVTITFHSTPALVGRAIADASGSFSAYVSVPDDATPGRHHFMANGTDPGGRPAELTAAVMVIAPAASGPSAATKALLSALALLVPVATWLAMAGAGWWRRRSAHRPASD